MSEIAEHAPGIEDIYRRLDEVYNEAIIAPRPPDGPPPIHIMEAQVRLLQDEISRENAAQECRQEKIDNTKKTELQHMNNMAGVPCSWWDIEKERRKRLVRDPHMQFPLQFNPDLERASVEGFSGSSATHKRKACEVVGTNAQWRAFTSEQRSEVIPPSKHAAATADQPNIVARGAAQIKVAGTCDRFIQVEDDVLKRVRCVKLEACCPWCCNTHTMFMDLGDKSIDALIDDLFSVYMPSELWGNAVRLGVLTKCKHCSAEFELRADKIHG